MGDGHAELGLDAPGLRLHRALKLLWPESWAARAKAKEALFEDAELVFASEPDRHVVRLNGELLATFRFSDARFSRLLLLAAARHADLDIEDGGWLKKDPALELDAGEVLLVDLRKALVADQDDFAGMSAAERKALLQSSPDHPKALRLPLNPRHVRFDPSLANLRLLGDKQNEPREEKSAKAKARKTEGSKILEDNMRLARDQAIKIFGRARALGVPLPDERALKS